MPTFHFSKLELCHGQPSVSGGTLVVSAAPMCKRRGAFYCYIHTQLVVLYIVSFQLIKVDPRYEQEEKLDLGLKSGIFFTKTKCEIRFIYIGFNCKRKRWGKKCLEICAIM